MNRKSRGISLVIVIALLIPVLSMGIQNMPARPCIWIVYAESPDESMSIAAQTFKSGMTSVGCVVRETTLDLLDSIPAYSDAIAIVGHGYEDGIVVSEGTLSWISLYDKIEGRNPLNIIALACHSPSVPKSRIFGFMGEIDAEAGAIIGTWHLSRTLGLKNIDSNLFDRAIESQKSLTHPLSRVVYFVHGYFGDSSEFSQMRADLESRGLLGPNGLYDEFRDYSYCEAFGASDAWEKYLLHQATSISDYAANFAFWLLQDLTPGTQVSIVAHSLGGIITRQMLMQNRTNLEAAGIDFGSVITFGTPHRGTYLASEDNIIAYMAFFMGFITTFQLWPSPVLFSLHPGTEFLNTLNYNPGTYLDGIHLYTVAGVDPLSQFMVPLHFEANDLLIGESRATLSVADSAVTIPGIGHGALTKNNLSYSLVESWLSFDGDSDGDGLNDDMETYRYGTDKYDWDSDDDGLPDGDEILIHSTDPLNSDSDFDNLSDDDEVLVYETDPLNSDSDLDTLSDYDEVIIYGSDPWDTDTDYDGLIDGEEVHIHGTIPTAWSTDGDMLSDNQEYLWGYDPTDTDDPIDAQSLTYTTWQVAGVTGRVRANHYDAMHYVKVYVKYKNSMGYWTSDFLAGIDYSPEYYGDYFVEWSILSGYVQMLVTVKAYDSSSHYLGYDTQYVTLPETGGGGRPGGDPVPE